MDLGPERELILGSYLAMAGGVPSFAFSAFSSTIQNRQRYSDTEINLIGSIMQAGVWTAVLGGVLTDRFGAKVAAAVAMTMSGVGWLAMWLLTTQASASNPPSWGWYGVAGYFCGQGGAYCYLAALKVNQAVCPSSHRGRVVGTLSAFVSLSAGLFAQIARSFFKGSDIFLMLIGVEVLLAMAAMWMRGRLESNTNTFLPETLRLMPLLQFVMAVTILVEGALDASASSGSSSSSLSDSTYLAFGIALLVLFAIPLVYLLLLIPRNTLQYEALSTTDDIPAPAPPAPTHPSEPLDTRHKVMGGLLFMAYMLGLGPSAAMVNVLAGMVVAVDSSLEAGKTYEVNDDGTGLPGYGLVLTLLTLFSVSNTAGRIATGMLVDRFTTVRKGAWLVLWCAAGATACAVYSFESVNSTLSLCFGVCFMGISVGGIQTIVPQLIHQIFGMKHFATVFSTFTLAPTTGSLIFASVIGKLTGSHSTKVYLHHPAAPEPVGYCFGDYCYRTPYIICGVTILTATFLACGVTLFSPKQ